MSELTESVIPPQEFVDWLNARRPPDVPLLTALDPVAMLWWHQVTEVSTPLIAVTGIS